MVASTHIRNYVFMAIACQVIIGKECPTTPASEVLRTPWLFDIRCVGMASASHDIRLRRSALILLNVAYWTIAEELLTVWCFARIEVPEEFHAGVDDNNVDIMACIFSGRRIEGLRPRTFLRHTMFAVTCCK